MLQEFHKKGGDINARDAYATPQTDVPILAPAESAPSAARERFPIWPEISALGLPPYPLTPFLWGLPPPWLPHPFCLFVFFPLHALPHMCRVPLVHAAAAWHRGERTPLMYAAEHGATAALELLVELGAALDAPSDCG
jgi:hypothetical protein